MKLNLNNLEKCLIIKKKELENIYSDYCKVQEDFPNDRNKLRESLSKLRKKESEIESLIQIKIKDKWF